MSDAVARLNAALEGRYAIERELGEGGMATVYLADDLKHERKVALKVLKPELAAVVGTVVQEDAAVRRIAQQQTFIRWVARLARSAVAALLLAVLGAGATAAQQIFVRVGDGTSTGVAPGGQISVPIVVDMSEAAGLDLASTTFDLNWDPSLLSFVSASPGSFGTVVFNLTETGLGLLTTSMFDVSGTTSSFTVATVVFDATASVPTEGQLAPITIGVTAAGNALGSNILGNVVGVDLLLCIGVGGLLGDVNDDGVVNIIDAQQVARFAVGLPPPPDPDLAEGQIGRASCRERV